MHVSLQIEAHLNMCRLVTYFFGVLKYVRYTSWNCLNLVWVTNAIKKTFELHCELLIFWM
jgi:hypothetical protein